MVVDYYYQLFTIVLILHNDHLAQHTMNLTDHSRQKSPVSTAADEADISWISDAMISVMHFNDGKSWKKVKLTDQ